MADALLTQLIADLRPRVEAVRAEIARAAARSGRGAEAVRLVAVTKTHPPAVLAAAAAVGLADLGENYLQEAADKFTALGWPPATAGAAPVQRHFIGHLQSNKLRPALTWFDLIHSVDSVKLAERLDRLAAAIRPTPVPVLLQVNTSGESTKSGFFFDALEGVLLRLANLAHIHVCGLMTIGRFEPDPDAARREFIALRTLRDRLQRQAPDGMRLTELSMGMSHDFSVAIEEGATIVRVGSRLFGPRQSQY